MRAENHPWWQRIEHCASNPGQCYGDIGQHGTVAYQVTGDVRYANNAIGLIRPYFNQCVTGNEFRDTVGRRAWMYDWLRPALSNEDRAGYLRMLRNYGNQILGRNVCGVTNGPRLADTDEAVGQYFGLAMIHLASLDDDPDASRLMDQVTADGTPVGGLNRGEGGTDRSTIRNAIRQYATVLAKGGQWPTGSEYNYGDLQYMFFGAEAVRTATGVDHFPEVTQLQNEVAQAIIQEMSPDLNAAYKWSDVENGNADLRMFRRAAIIGMLTGLTEKSEHTSCSPESIGPCIVSFLAEMGAKYGFADQFAHNDAQPFILTNPYAAKDDWKKLPGAFYAPGQGLAYHHTGWDASGSRTHTLAGFHFPSRQYPHRNPALELQVDHHVAYFGNFQIYRKGEWAITHPQDYGGPTQWGTGTNTMLTAGLPSVFVSEPEVKGVTGYEAGPNGSYLYYAGTIAGSSLAEGDWNPPPTFLHEATRTFLYLPSTNGTADSLVIYDRNNAKDPRTLPSGLDNYRDVRVRIEDALSSAYSPGMKQWLIHSLTDPVQDANGISWTTAGGQQVRVDTHLPKQRRMVEINLAEVWPKQWPYPFAEDQRWQTRIIYTGTDQYATFLNVVHAHDAGIAPVSVLLRSTDSATAEGALISRPNHNDVVVMFGARPGPDLAQPTSAVCPSKIPGECQSGDWKVATANHNRAAKARIVTRGYTVELRSSSSETDVFLTDLDIARNWRLTVDGTDTPLTVSGQGLGRATVAGAGDHILVLSVAGSTARARVR